MNAEQFRDQANLAGLTETSKACYLAFYHLKTAAVEEFSARQAAEWLGAVGFSRPNVSRLDANLRSARDTIRGCRPGCFKLHLKLVKELETRFPLVSEKSQEVSEHGTVLPEIDYCKTRGYIESLARQINASFEHNLFDGCTVLMRRLVEVLLILSYRHTGIESAIQDGNGTYYMLERIINDAKTNGRLALSRNAKEHLDTFRQLGNFSAHRIEYICRREYISPHIQEYRALVAELLHKSGIRT